METAINREAPAVALELRDWQGAAMQHRERLDPIVSAHLKRRSQGEKHPVVDFLFEYYRFRPSHLMRWTPGLGVRLKGGAAEYQGDRHWTSLGEHAWITLANIPPKLRGSTRWILDLLQQTQARPPMFGCNGLHEWAMVYRSPEVRHAATPLRLTPSQIREVVEESSVVCSHWDAFRFFTPEARPLNRLTPEAGRMAEFEQPGCLHANMDLYRWAMKRHPWISSEITRDAFLLALDIRAVDMRASPYDLRELGYEPIAIETESGRTAYRDFQISFHQRAHPIRERLISAYEALCAALDQV